MIGDVERDAIGRAGRSDALILDPVYTGRAMGALIGMVESGLFSPDDCVLFWHTGGQSGLFARAEELL